MQQLIYELHALLSSLSREVIHFSYRQSHPLMEILRSIGKKYAKMSVFSYLYTYSLLVYQIDFFFAKMRDFHILSVFRIVVFVIHNYLEPSSLLHP